MTQNTLNLNTKKLGTALVKKGWILATAESCTGGGIAAQVTEIAGSSEWFHGGFVVYSNEWKHHFLQVPEETLIQHGAVSEETVQSLLQGIFCKTEANLAIAVSGIAGPGGGTSEKPVGTVYIGVALRQNTTADARPIYSVERCQFEGDRSQVRRSTIERAILNALKITTDHM